MHPFIIGSFFIIYSILLFTIAHFTSRKANNQTYLRGNRSSPWYLVAYGMIGASLSGVTFMSVPGWVRDSGFSYVMMIAGFVVGYVIIAFVLLPLYYKLNLTSIYTYLNHRFGLFSRKTGSFLFLISRSIGSSLRMFLVINILHVFILKHLGVPFIVSATLFILLILLYTFKGGIKTIVYTDTLQTTFMIAAVVIIIVLICNNLGLNFSQLSTKIINSNYTYVIDYDWHSKKHWLKQFLSGVFITIVMTGLDQEMMQKNLTCKTLKDAQKNMLTFSVVLFFVNLSFLILGASLFLYANANNLQLPELTDLIFPQIAINELGGIAAIVFIIGLVSAAYSSADGTVTSLTTSFIVDILDIDKKYKSEKQKTNIRHKVHFIIAFFLLMLVVLFKEISNDAVIEQVYKIAGYTYGPLLGLFAFGMFTKFNIKEQFVPFIAISSPIITYILDVNSVNWFGGYKFGFELLIVNGLITTILLFSVIKKTNRTKI